MVKKLSKRGNVYRFLITADHGFIYTRRPLEATDKLANEAGKEGLWYRFATNEDYILSISDFAYSGNPLEVLQKMEFDYDSLKLKIENLMK